MAYTNIDDPSAYFQALTYTGNGSNPRNLTNDGNSDLKPDLIWGKSRGTNIDHQLYDSSRGFGTSKGLQSNSTAAESGQTTYGYISASLTDGFTAAAGGTNGDWFNRNNDPFVAWQWKANGGTTSSNTDGNTTTTVQANQDAGFSIVTYTGTGSSSQTMGHGLGVIPNIVLTKNRSGTGRAWSFNGNFGGMTYGTNKLILNQTSALTADTNDVIAASSTTFTGGGSNGVNANGVTYVAYCFAEKQGYSKFGKYVGNGNASNGSFIYTGFKPAFVMIKRSDGATNWRLFDNKRSGYNGDTSQLYPNLSNAEDSAGDQLELLSNGFKNRTVSGDQNGSGNDYIYMAFAENPFVTSTGIPTTAR